MVGEFAVLAILESKSRFTWQNRIESESKPHFEISISRIESEEMPIETSENIDIDNRLLKSNKSIEGQTQNDTSLLNQWQQKAKKRKQIKRVTWNKNLTDIKLISPRVNNNNQQNPTTKVKTSVPDSTLSQIFSFAHQRKFKQAAFQPKNIKYQSHWLSQANNPLPLSRTNAKCSR
jgi:hypothetical protein